MYIYVVRAPSVRLVLHGWLKKRMVLVSIRGNDALLAAGRA